MEPCDSSPNPHLEAQAVGGQRRAPLAIEAKADESPVTEADRQVGHSPAPCWCRVPLLGIPHNIALCWADADVAQRARVFPLVRQRPHVALQPECESLLVEQVGRCEGFVPQESNSDIGSSLTV